MGGRSTYGIGDFAASWIVEAGEADGVDLGELEVVMAGRYLDDEPGVPALYIDDRADRDQVDALAANYLAHVDNPSLGVLEKVVDPYAVRPAAIRLDHRPENWQIEVDDYVTVRAREPVDTDETVACAIPGYERPGTAYHIEVLYVDEPPLCWEVTGQTGFASTYAYDSPP